MRQGIATFVINLEHRYDRRLEVTNELEQIGWQAEFFPAIRPAHAAGFPSVGARGCFLSHLGVLKKAYGTGAERILILEDDVSFAPGFSTRWSTAVELLERQRWSIFYPGHVIEGISEGLSPVLPSIGVQCTHFMMFARRAIPVIIEGLESILSRPPGHPLGGPMHADGAYSTIRSQNLSLATYAYFPPLGFQRPSRTDVGDLKWFDRIQPLKPLIETMRKLKLKAAKLS